MTGTPEEAENISIHLLVFKRQYMSKPVFIKPEDPVGDLMHRY
jgi:hypothetical protein